MEPDLHDHPIRREFDRRFADSFDFYAAVQYAELLLPSLEEDAVRQELDVYRRLAYWTGLVISYCRPFTKNHDRFGEREPPEIRRQLEDRIPAHLKKRHAAILEERHRLIAHNDLGKGTIKRVGAPWSWKPVLDRDFELPDLDEAREADALARHFCEFTIRRWEALRSEVEPGSWGDGGGWAR